MGMSLLEMALHFAAPQLRAMELEEPSLGFRPSVLDCWLFLAASGA